VKTLVDNAGPSDALQVARHDDVVMVTIHRPERRNAIDAETAKRMAALLVELRTDPKAGAVILQGSGGTFCAGGDVGKVDFSSPRSSEERLGVMEPFHRLTTALATFPKPVVAAVDGPAYGAGFSLALLADIVIMTDRARLCMAFQRIGLVPDMGALYTLPRAVGMQRARELLLTAREVDAHEARSLGLALEVVEPEALLTCSLEIARSLARASPAAVALTKMALSQTFGSDLQGMLNLEVAGQAVAASTQYFQEALRRFAAREEPQFVWPVSHNK
jgi:2-(1,2-epoxy-1,2-dihydrophenyl)acetyl-CoA isomerase